MRWLLVSIFFSCSLVQADGDTSYKFGERTFDSLNYRAGTVLQSLPNGDLELRLDGDKTGTLYSKTGRPFSSYYVDELGPLINPCEGLAPDAPHDFLCKGDSFVFKMPVVGNGRVGIVTEIFQGKDGLTDDNRYGKIIYGVQLEEEKSVRYLNYDHAPWMVRLPAAPTK